MENPIKMDDLGVPLFLETPMLFLLQESVDLTIGHISKGPMTIS